MGARNAPEERSDSEPIAAEGARAGIDRGKTPHVDVGMTRSGCPRPRWFHRGMRAAARAAPTSAVAKRRTPHWKSVSRCRAGFIPARGRSVSHPEESSTRDPELTRPRVNLSEAKDPELLRV
jgi:hypothetical protein